VNDSGLEVRKLKFEYPDHFDANWAPHRTEFSCVANSISLAMPYLEPYVVKAVSKYLPEIEELEDDNGVVVGNNVCALVDDFKNETSSCTEMQDLYKYDSKPNSDEVRKYLAQETQHHIQHRKFNKIIQRQYPKLAISEKLMAKTFKWFEKKRSKEFNLALSTTFETFAYSVARWTAQNQRELFKDANPEVLRLFTWHLGEEVEHKSTVFNIWKAVGGRRRTQIAASIITVLITAFFVIFNSMIMLTYEKRIFNPVSWFRLIKWGITFAFEMIPTLAIATMKNFHPTELADPIAAQLWLDEIEYEEQLLQQEVAKV